MRVKYIIIMLLIACQAWAVAPRPGVDFGGRVMPHFAWDDAPQRVAARQMPQQVIAREGPAAPRGPVILVSFKDTLFRTPAAEIDSMFNGYNYTRNYTIIYAGGTKQVIKSSGSVRQYFYDQSRGQYNPQFDIIGPVTVSRECAYYGKNNWRDNDKNVQDLIKEACQAVDKQVNFAQYDSDNDGKVDFVYILFAGFAESDGAGSDLIWPHSSDLSYMVSLQLDGKLIASYGCSNERSYATKLHEGIGTVVHEFGHVLGLPDLYNTESDDNNQFKTLGTWDVMDGGNYLNDGNTPPNYSAYERFYLGWQTPRLLNDTADITLEPLHKGGETLMVTETGQHNKNGVEPSPSTFYLLENRQRSGWDKFLPGHGLLITKVQYNAHAWLFSAFNADSTKMGVDIIEADGEAPANSYGKLTDAFPAGATHYNTEPPFDRYTITDITENTFWGTISFKFMGGKSGTGLTPVHPSAEGIRKELRRGRLVIYHNGRAYTVSGQAINE